MKANEKKYYEQPMLEVVKTYGTTLLAGLSVDEDDDDFIIQTGKDGFLFGDDQDTDDDQGFRLWED